MRHRWGSCGQVPPSSRRSLCLDCAGVSGFVSQISFQPKIELLAGTSAGLLQEDAQRACSDHPAFGATRGDTARAPVASIRSTRTLSNANVGAAAPGKAPCNIKNNQVTCKSARVGRFVGNKVVWCVYFTSCARTNASAYKPSKNSSARSIGRRRISGWSAVSALRNPARPFPPTAPARQPAAQAKDLTSNAFSAQQLASGGDA